MSSDFSHLHVHSEYSLLDGLARIEEIVKRTEEMGMTSVAMTDHGVMYGLVEFYHRCQEAGIKPIVGCEVYVAPRTRHDREPRVDDDPYHLLLLAENQAGFHNLLKLVSRAYTEGLYYKPRVDQELLSTCSEGLIVSSACLGGEIPTLFLRGQEEEAVRRAEWYREVFGKDNFFLELQDHGLKEQEEVNPFLVDLAQRLGVGLIATNDSHYINRKDAGPHDILLCVQTGRSVDEENRMKFPNDQFYLKSPEEMRALFGHVPQALQNTVAIAERCNVKLDLETLHLPSPTIPEGFADASGYLRHLCRSRLPQLIPSPSEEIGSRLDYELDMIETMGYPGYFLIVWDFVEFARKRGIPVGPGRGSVAGSLVAYVLGITKVNPLDYNLPFERFLNPERVSLPDVDIDFCFERRDEIIDYVVQKYGEDCVSKIVTFGTMAARAVIRDVGRALKLPYNEVDRVAKQVPYQLGVTLEEALDSSPELASSYRQRPEIRRLIDLARSLEGLPRHASVHAAGVVIADQPLVNYVPLQKMGDGSVVTQMDMDDVAELGLLKMDFLALRTLTVIHQTTRIIQHLHSVSLDPDEIPLDDEKTYDLLSQGQTAGVFQLESSGMKELLRKLRPESIEDVIAAVALYRPGPMENIPLFLEQKHAGKVEYPHPLLEPILKDTYGIIVYQEQIMRIASTMAGFSLGQADILRKGIGKKQEDIIEEMREQFVEGCIEQGHDRTKAKEIFDLIHKFARYGFNKCHTTPYALLAYQTAYLKAHYPVEFMASLLTSVRENSDKVAAHIGECRRMGIQVLPPDVNESLSNFTVVSGALRFGLAAVKNVGLRLVEGIIEERKTGPYRSLRDLCTRVDTSLLNRRALESLAKAGALDSLGDRAQLLPVLEQTLQAAHAIQREMGRGQVSLFDLGNGSGPDDDETPFPDELPTVPPLPTSEKLAMEKEVLGVYLSGHPLGEYQEEMKSGVSHSFSELEDLEDGTPVSVGGFVIQVKRVVTRNGEPMAFATVEDMGGQGEILIFPKTLKRVAPLVDSEAPILVSGHVSRQDDELKVIAEQIVPLRERERMVLSIPRGMDRAALAQLKTLLERSPGLIPVYLRFESSGSLVRIDPRYWIRSSASLQEDIQGLLGPGRIRMERPGQEVRA